MLQKFVDLRAMAAGLLIITMKIIIHLLDFFKLAPCPVYLTPPFTV